MYDIETLTKIENTTEHKIVKMYFIVKLDPMRIENLPKRTKRLDLKRIRKQKQI